MLKRCKFTNNLFPFKKIARKNTSATVGGCVFDATPFFSAVLFLYVWNNQ